MLSPAFVKPSLAKLTWLGCAIFLLFWFYLCMNNSPPNLNSIRQPAPSVGGSDAQVERKFNLPKVGVLSVPTISKTPLGDVLALKKQENPKMAYKITPKSNKGFKLQTFFSLSIIGCSIGALLKLIKKK